MIYTLTLNPAIDRTIYTDSLNLDDVTRVNVTLRDAAGKGINVSKVLHQLNQQSTCLGFVGGAQGDYIKNELNKRIIPHNFIEVDGETRENIKVIIDSPKQVLELNESGPMIKEENITSLFQNMDKTLQAGDYLIIAGSIPKGVPQDIYKKIIERYQFVNVILDVSGDVFTQSIEGIPFAIKPNKYELELYKNKKLNTIHDIIEVCNEFIQKGIKHVFVSLGKEGALYVNEKTSYKALVPQLDAKSTVGAGDSFVAGMVHSMSQNNDNLSVLIDGCSIGSASVLSKNTASINLQDVKKIKENIVTIKL